MPFWSILASKMEPKKCVRKIFWGIFWGSKMLFVFVLFWIASKTAQEGPGGAQEAPGSPPECLKRPQEAPKSAPGGSKRASRDPKSRSRGLKTLQDRPKRLQKTPRTLNIQRGTWSNSKDALLRCPATECKTGMPKNGGRAAVMPLGARQFSWYLDLDGGF